MALMSRQGLHTNQLATQIGCQALRQKWVSALVTIFQQSLPSLEHNVHQQVEGSIHGQGVSESQFFR